MGLILMGIDYIVWAFPDVGLILMGMKRILSVWFSKYGIMWKSDVEASSILYGDLCDDPVTTMYRYLGFD